MKRTRASMPGAARAALVVIVGAAATAAGGCASFEDPTIVIDLRVLGAVATPPEQVVPFDVEDPTNVELVDSEICVLVADPGVSRQLRYDMIACAPTGSGRCGIDDDGDEDAVVLPLGGGTIDDPEEAATTPAMCGTVPAGPDLLAVIRDAIAGDDLLGFGGIDVMVSIEITPIDDDGRPSADPVWAAKRIRFAPKEPAEREANLNPTLERIAVTRVDDPVAEPLPLGRCRDITPLEVAPDEVLALDPIEPIDVREDYVVPTFDGGFRMFTENMRYSWLATAGEWSSGDTGGTRDPFGNEATLDTEWTAPPAADLDGPLDVSLWIIQRDERLGVAWFESCVRVVP